MKKTLIRLTESDIHNIVMNSVKQIINEGYDEHDSNRPEWFNKLNQIVTSEGWPALSIGNDGKIKSIDEDTVITFGTDENDGTPYISDIHCSFYNSDPVHMRDLNGLVALYQKMWDYTHWSIV